MKKIIFVLLLLFGLVLVGCNNIEEPNNEIKEIKIDTFEIDPFVYVDEFSLDMIKILCYRDKSMDEVVLTKDMISNEDYNKLLIAGSYEITVNYEDFIESFNIILKDKEIEPVSKCKHDELELIPEVPATTDSEGLKAHYYCPECEKYFNSSKEEVNYEDLIIAKFVIPEEITYHVTFIGFNNQIVKEYDVKEKSVLTAYPELDEVPGYKFLEWDVVFPYRVTSDVVITASYRERPVVLEETALELDEMFGWFTTLEKDLNLPTDLNDIMITWASSDESYLTSDGKYTRNYQDKDIKLTAILSNGIETLTKEYDYKCMGYRDLTNGIASGYVYRDYGKLTDEFFDTMDIIYCAFITFNESGMYSSYDTRTNIKKYITPKAKEKGIYVIPSLGGGGSSPAATFSKIAASASLRKTFVENVIKLINENGYDGVDIDWETPSSSEKENFTLLMKELYTAVKANNPNHLVTAAIAGGMWQPPRYDLPNSIKYLDYVNSMTYGMVSNGGQYQNALYKSTTYNDSTNKVGKTLTSCSIEETIEIYNDLGVPNNKMIFGLAFYGMSQNLSNGTWTSGSSVFYTSIKNKYLTDSNYIERYDEKAQVPYIISKDGTFFISYDNAKSVLAKIEYMKLKGCAGVMYWENGCDLTGDLVHAIKTGYNK